MFFVEPVGIFSTALSHLSSNGLFRVGVEQLNRKREVSGEVIAGPFDDFEFVHWR